MSAPRWVITTHVTGKPRAVEVRLYSDLNHLRGAATRHIARTGETGGDTSGTLAICHGYIRGWVGPAGEWNEHPTVATIRVAASHLTPLILSHEVAHAAQHIYGLDFDDGRSIAEHMTAGNEDFAHLYGELFAAVWAIFHEEL